MTAPISNEPTTTRLHHYAGRYLLVSTVAFQGRAVVMGVSCWPASVVAEVSLVASSPRAGSCARKSSPCVRKMAENRWFVACWTSFFAPTGVVPRTCRQCGALQACCGGGFAALEAGWSSVPHSGVTVWWSARLIWVRSPCDPSRKLSTSDSK